MARCISHALGVSVVISLSLFADWAVAAGDSPNQAAASSVPRDEGADAKQSQGHERARFLGATLDVGFPDGAVLGVVARPCKWSRLAAGGGTNGISPGIRGGFALIPLGSGPSAVLEGGHYFEGNLNTTASALGRASDGNRMADRIGYQFVNMHLGMELGQDQFTFFLHGGMSYIHTVLYNANAVLGGSSENTTVATSSNPVITAWIPSFKLGLIFYLV